MQPNVFRAPEQNLARRPMSWDASIAVQGPNQQAPAAQTQSPPPRTDSSPVSAAVMPQNTNPTLPFLPPSWGTGQPLEPGQQHPFSQDPYPVLGAPSGPSQQATQQFMPSVFSDPYLSGMSAAANIGSYASAAVPQAAAFQQGMYSPFLNPMEQAFLGSSAALGRLGLEDAFNRIDTQYENSPMASGRTRMYSDAANQFAQQMGQLGSQMGLSRQAQAAQMLPTTFGFPLQASQFGQQSAEGLYGMMQHAMTGDLQYPMSFYSGYPLLPPTVMQSAGGGKR